jgi:hypothetical protein
MSIYEVARRLIDGENLPLDTLPCMAWVLLADIMEQQGYTLSINNNMLHAEPIYLTPVYQNDMLNSLLN